MEHKLKEDSRLFCGDSRHKNLEDDIKELIKFIRASESNHKWDVNDLQLNTIKVDDIFGTKEDRMDVLERHSTIEMSLSISDIDNL